jgi:hypothetical protein
MQSTQADQRMLTPVQVTWIESFMVLLASETRTQSSSERRAYSNQTLKLTGATISVSRDLKQFQADPAA